MFPKVTKMGSIVWPQNRLQWGRNSDSLVTHTQQKLTQVPPPPPSPPPPPPQPSSKIVVRTYTGPSGIINGLVNCSWCSWQDEVN